jgi:signal transduction histidine kinase
MQGRGENMGDHARRVAAELHDGAMQELTLARLQLDLLAASVQDDRRLLGELVGVAEALDEASHRLRELMRTLGSGGLELVQTSS